MNIATIQRLKEILEIGRHDPMNPDYLLVKYLSNLLYDLDINDKHLSMEDYQLLRSIYDN